MRKLKRRDAKLLTLTELGGGSMDLRFKMMGQYSFDEVPIVRPQLFCSSHRRTYNRHTMFVLTIEL